MRFDGFDIPDADIDRLLAAFGADRSALDDPEEGPRRLAAIVRYALDSLAREVSAAAPAEREEIEAELLRMAGAPLEQDASSVLRGVPHHVRPARGGALPIGDAPRSYRALDSRIAALYQVLAENPELRRSISWRLLQTNEQYRELVVADALEPIFVDASFDGRRYRFRLSPDGLLVIGAILDNPIDLDESGR